MGANDALAMALVCAELKLEELTPKRTVTEQVCLRYPSSIIPTQELVTGVPDGSRFRVHTAWSLKSPTGQLPSGKSEITYLTGWDTLPYDIQSAIDLLAAHLDAAPPAGVLSEKIDDQAIQYDPNHQQKLISPAIQALLRRYRRVKV